MYNLYIIIIYGNSDSYFLNKRGCIYVSLKFFYSDKIETDKIKMEILKKLKSN